MSPNSSRIPSADTTCSRPPPSPLKHTHRANKRRSADTPPLLTHPPRVSHTPLQSRRSAAPTPAPRPRQSTRITCARKTAVPWRQSPRKPTGMETTGTAGQSGSDGILHRCIIVLLWGLKVLNISRRLCL